MKLTPLLITVLNCLTNFVSDSSADGCIGYNHSTNCACSADVLSCNGLQLTTVPANIPVSITKIEMKLNNVTSLDESCFTGMTSLTYIVLNYNLIETIATNTFQDLTALKNLQLRSNLLTSLPEGVFSMNIALLTVTFQDNQISTLPGSLFNKTTSLVNANFAGNPMMCCTIEAFLTRADDIGNKISLDCTDFNQIVALTAFVSANCTPIDGQWGDWRNSSCSVTCGSGIITRTRSCNSTSPAYGGSDCNGSSTATVTTCILDGCMVDGQWGDWINSSCSVTCSRGTMTRKRSCDSPSPVYGGANCSGVSAEIVVCKFDDCIESKELAEMTPLIIGIVIGVTFVSGMIALVTILLIKYTSPKVMDHNFNNNNKQRHDFSRSWYSESLHPSEIRCSTVNKNRQNKRPLRAKVPQLSKRYTV